jgi:hypothetical protein
LGVVLAATMLGLPSWTEAAPAGEARKVTFKTLSTYPVEAAGEAVPAAFRELNGARVVVTGYVLPLSYANGRTRQFMLMRSQASCCFGLPPKANEFVLVTTEAEEGVPAIQDVPAAMTGVFRVEPVKSGDVVLQCFRLEQARAL